MDEPYDAIVVGGGAAGLSAALILGRSCRRVVVCDEGRPRNAVANRMHGFLSRDGMPPQDLLAAARQELENYRSVRFVRTRIVHAAREETAFTARDERGEQFTGRRIVLATGVYDTLPAIAGLAERWGTSVFVCPYCDGWEMRGKRLAIVGKGRKAVELAQELRQWSDDILICTQGTDDLTSDDRRWLAATKLPVRSATVVSFRGEGRALERVYFDQGEPERCDAAFLCAPLRARYPLVEMLGCRLRADGEIEIDERGRTNVQGCYAAGDAVTSVHQVVLAAASGVCAAMALNEDLLAQEVREVSGSGP